MGEIMFGKIIYQIRMIGGYQTVSKTVFDLCANEKRWRYESEDEWHYLKGGLG